MLSNKGIDTNLSFLILEVRKQIQKTKRFLDEPTNELRDSVLVRDDYIDNLRSIIQRKCFAQVAMLATADDPDVHILKAYDVVSQNLERIADFCEDIVDQVGHVANLELLQSADFDPFFEEIIAAIDRVDQALFGRKVQTALKICRAEHKLDQLYAKAFRRTMLQLEQRGEPHTNVTALFIFHYLERMGDSLLNVGEAVISACLGERLKISRFWALEDTIEGGVAKNASGVWVQPMADTKSGARISRVEGSSTPAKSRAVIFKEGRFAKLVEERQNIERWQQVMPGIAPRIHSFHEQGEMGAILFEYLPGRTFEELLLSGDTSDVDTALHSICDTLGTLWTKTREEKPACAHFLHQLKRRLQDVFTVHPEFRRPRHAIGTVAVRSFAELLETALPVVDELAAPFSVFIHGDFNVDNVIFDAETQQVRFIDLHRSCVMDYVQDVSVFLVSNYRLQALEQPMRARLNKVMEQFFDFGRDFAAGAKDDTFEARLCLGIARSLVTSTRFVLDPGMAKEMFLRARYLIEQIMARGDHELKGFRIPREVLVA